MGAEAKLEAFVNNALVLLLTPLTPLTRRGGLAPLSPCLLRRHV